MAKDIFNHLEDLDAAAKDKNYTAAIGEYKEVVSDFDAFLGLVPQTQEPVSQAERAMEQAEEVFAEVKAEVEETVERITPDFEEVEETAERVTPDVEEAEETAERVTPDFEEDV